MMALVYRNEAWIDSQEFMRRQKHGSSFDPLVRTVVDAHFRLVLAGKAEAGPSMRMIEQERHLAPIPAYLSPCQPSQRLGTEYLHQLLCDVPLHRPLRGLGSVAASPPLGAGCDHGIRQFQQMSLAGPVLTDEHIEALGKSQLGFFERGEVLYFSDLNIMTVSLWSVESAAVVNRACGRGRAGAACEVHGPVRPPGAGYGL